MNVHTQHHAGINPTYKRIKLNWPGLTTDMSRLIKTCEICHATTNSRHPFIQCKHRLFSNRPWQVVSIDLVSPLTLTPRGNKMILVISDNFMRWKDAIAKPVYSKSSYTFIFTYSFSGAVGAVSVVSY